MLTIDDTVKFTKNGTYSSLLAVGTGIANAAGTFAELSMTNIKLRKTITSISFDRYNINLYKWDGTTLFNYDGTGSSKVTIAVAYYYTLTEKYISIKIAGTYSPHQICWISANFTNVVLS